MTPPAPSDLRWLPDRGGFRRFELTSRGDRIEVALSLPSGAARLLVVALSDDASETRPLEDVATLTFDLPLLGVRSSPKWTERLKRCLAEGARGAADRALMDELASQGAADVAAALDACRALPELAEARPVLVGLGAGAFVGARLRDLEPRIAGFALSGAGLAAEWDPSGSLDEDGSPPSVAASGLAAGATRLRERLAL